MNTALERLFIGVYPCGIVYSDRGREVAGDYRRLAFLPYRSLVLQVESDCPSELRRLITEDAARYKPGDVFEISASGQTVILGGAPPLREPPTWGALARLPAETREERGEALRDFEDDT